MSSAEQTRQAIAALQKQAAVLRKEQAKVQGDEVKEVSAAREKRERAGRTSSASTARMNLRSAEQHEKKAAARSKTVADLTKKLADNSKKQADKGKALETAVKSSDRKRDQEDNRRRQTEKQHARQVAQMMTPRVIHETRLVPAPQPEKLRVLYLAANPELNLRVDAEVRSVREAIRKALHRDLVDLDHWPAATPEDLLDGLSQRRPHVVHFSGHGAEGFLLFDDAEHRDQDVGGDQPGRVVSFDLLARALDSTDQAPTLLVLNACESLTGAEVLLPAVPVVIGMADSISDLAANAFATRFYAAIADGQSVGSALKQGSVAVDFLLLSEGWKPQVLAREDVNLPDLILVRPPADDHGASEG